MKKIENLQRGMGIGGWLTNYKRFNVLPPERRMQITIGDMEHFALCARAICPLMWLTTSGCALAIPFVLDVPRRT